MKPLLLLALLLLAGCTRGHWQHDSFTIPSFKNESVYILDSTGRMCGDIFQFENNTDWDAFVFNTDNTQKYHLAGTDRDFAKKFVEEHCK